jgi:hypothetical protein
MAQTVFWVLLTTVIRRLPVGAVVGMAGCWAWAGLPVVAVDVGLRVAFGDALGLAAAEGEALWLGAGDGECAEVVGVPDGRAAAV